MLSPRVSGELEVCTYNLLEVFQNKGTKTKKLKTEALWNKKWKCCLATLMPQEDSSWSKWSLSIRGPFHNLEKDPTNVSMWSYAFVLLSQIRCHYIFLINEGFSLIRPLSKDINFCQYKTWIRFAWFCLRQALATQILVENELAQISESQRCLFQKVINYKMLHILFLPLQPLDLSLFTSTHEFFISTSIYYLN